MLDVAKLRLEELSAKSISRASNACGELQTPFCQGNVALLYSVPKISLLKTGVMEITMATKLVTVLERYEILACHSPNLIPRLVFSLPLLWMHLRVVEHAIFQKDHPYLFKVVCPPGHRIQTRRYATCLPVSIIFH